jgi:hypothetical protein
VFKFLKRGRGKQEKGGKADSSPSQPAASVPASTLQHNANYPELTRVVLRDTLRMNGIPTDWIACESTPRTQGGADGSLLIQLVINRWHEGLPSYAPLLQQQFQQGLQRFDPASDHSGHVIVWKFSPNCGYPGTTMPAADFWTSMPTFAGKRKFDLPVSDRDHLDDDFAPTVPGDFR